VSKIQYYSFPLGLWKLQLFYRLGQRFDRWRRSRKKAVAALPVICVGNFQAGGTGKTPVTQWVANSLKELGYEPIILLRGYKGRTVKSTVVDRPDASLFGDEALLHARNFPTIVGKNRVESCALAQTIARTNKAVIVLDDGLQYYELHKNFSIVCQKTKFDYDTLLPQGRLREIPHTNVDAIVSVVDHVPAEKETDWEGVPNFFLQRHSAMKKGALEPGAMVCGIAKPDDFFYNVQKAIGFIGPEFKFKDHHRFTRKDLNRLELATEKFGYRVHCTAKDAVKLEPLIREAGSPLKLSVWDVELVPDQEASALVQAIAQKIEEVYINRARKEA
jgi:tetraacyldisaccharide 4'-kinase